MGNENHAKSVEVLTYLTGAILYQVIDDTLNIKMRMRTDKKERGRSLDKYFFKF